MKFLLIHNRKKFLIFIISCLVLFFISYNSFKIGINTNNVYMTRNENNLFVTGIKSGNSLAVYNTQNSTYYFSNGLFNSKHIKIVSPYDCRYILKRIDNDFFEILIFSDKYYQKKYIKILDIPIVSIKTDYSIPVNEKLMNINDIFNGFSSNYYTNILLEVLDSKALKNSLSSTLYQTGRYRVRGATSSLFPKKPYKLELDSKTQILGMPSDDDWILDALYTDKSKIRNKFASDLWNSINNNQEINNDINGEFVELFINDEYNGLYVLKEKVNKNTVALGDDGLLAKSITHLNADIINNFSVGNVSLYERDGEKMLENFELKRFNNNSIHSFINNIRRYYVSYDYGSINDSFYFDNYLNYQLLLLFVNGVDNVTKNQYFSMSNIDSKILITPWDLDLTFGLDYCEECELKSIDDFYNCYDDGLLTYNVLGDIDSETFNMLKQRYWQLRENILAIDNLNEYIDKYKKLLVESGAGQRDSDCWYEYDIEFEIEQIREWIKLRIDFLDDYFSYAM